MDSRFSSSLGVFDISWQFVVMVTSALLVVLFSYASSFAPLKTISKERGSFRSSLSEQPLQWFQDLMDSDSENSEDEVEDEAVRDFHDNNSRVLHFCFLVHGHRGFSRDLSYLQRRMQRLVREERSQLYTDRQEGKEAKYLDLIVHATECNERRTDDGVENGGGRLADEVEQVVMREIRNRSERDENHTISLSFLGNSLGGLYSRYALALLHEKGDETDKGVFVWNKTINVHANVFCTTATPHLGIAGHTYLPIPRTAEIGVAHAMGNTGRDLFRLNDLLKRMATEPRYLDPLKKFRRRVAYANAYGTDFPVPTQTAAFLSESSSYPHYFPGEDSGDSVAVDDNGLVIATLHTDPVESCSPSSESEEDNTVSLSDLEEMSRALDSLGWKKVFIDVRKEIPKLPLKNPLRPRSSTVSRDGASAADEERDDTDGIVRLKEQGVASSRDVAAVLSLPDEKFHWPMGHNMMVAFSRSKLSSYMNKAGRPIVDSLAKELVSFISSFDVEEIQ